jgi:hypothetical protein
MSINCYQCVHHWSDFEPIKGSVAIPVVWIGGANSLEVLEDIKSIEGCHKNIFTVYFSLISKRLRGDFRY